MPSSPTKRDPCQAFRLNYSTPTDEEMEVGMERLEGSPPNIAADRLTNRTAKPTISKRTPRSGKYHTGADVLREPRTG